MLVELVELFCYLLCAICIFYISTVLQENGWGDRLNDLENIRHFTHPHILGFINFEDD